MDENTLYRENDTILYSTHGVCKISEIAEMDSGGKRIEYYALKPIYYDRCTIFVPVNNKALTAKMRPLLSEEAIYALLEAMPNESPVWVENDADRGERYKEILDGGDRTALVKLIKALYFHQQTQRDKGKKLNDTDKVFMRSAEKMLYDEFAHVLKIKREEVLPFIIERIEAEHKA
jgi:CarD family transcriptional regulator